MFESMMGLTEQSGTEMDGAITRDAMTYQRSTDYPVNPEQRSELENFVYAHTPCRHKFVDNAGRRGIVYFDQRGRAADVLIGEMAASELYRQARIHGWRGLYGASRGTTPGDTAHGTLAMRDGARNGAGYVVHPMEEQEEIPASDIPDPTDENPDYMPLVRRMVKVIADQSAPRSKVSAKRKPDGNILIHVDQFTPLVVDDEGYVYETAFGHVSPNRRVGHIRDLLETGFEFKLNALSYHGFSQTLTRPRITEEDLSCLPEGALKDAANKLRESFGGMQFDASRAWVIGVDRYTLDQLVATGTLDRTGDQYTLVKLRQESAEIGAARLVEEGWSALEERKRTEPVAASLLSNVLDLGHAFWASLEHLQKGLGVATTWDAMVTDYDASMAAEKLSNKLPGFDRHSRTWRAGITWLKDLNGKIDYDRLAKDVKTSMAKASKLMKELDKVARKVEKADPAEYKDALDELEMAREGYRRFMKDGELFLKGLQAASAS